MQAPPLLGISSMATRGVLAALAQHWAEAHPMHAALQLESVGGVDAARRVADGEAFDLVFLARDAIDGLLHGGHGLAGSAVDLLRSEMAVAIPSSAAGRPNIDTEAGLREAVTAAPRIAYSTGPSGAAVLRLFARWGQSEALAPRLVQARPGVPVASLLAQGQADLGFQQRSELQGVPGVQVLGAMPPGCGQLTTFSAAVCVRSTRVQEAAALLAWMALPSHTPLLQAHGMVAPEALPETEV
jgi:molybdate transport system substrate-binding protein